MKRSYIGVIIFIGLCKYITSKHHDNILQKAPLIEVSGVIGSTVVLPCDIRPAISDDRPYLVLFYKGATRTPVFSLDARGGSLSSGDAWSEPSVMGDRAHFDLMSLKTGLVLKYISLEDESTYRCRVDFESSPTRNSRVKLVVVVPPKALSFVNEDDEPVQKTVGPFKIGNTIRIKCIAIGGNPQPTVTWWKNDILLDIVSEQSGETFVSNLIIIKSLTRLNYNTVLVCRASSSNMTNYIHQSIRIDMTLPPIDVMFVGNIKPVQEGTPIKLVCQTTGSVPPAEITWWKNGFQIISTKNNDDTPFIQTFTNSNSSKSIIILVPLVSDDKTHLICRATNKDLPSSAVEASIKLQVHYSPRVSILGGSSLNIHNIREGEDFYFECDIRANPPVDHLRWMYNGKRLHHNSLTGIIHSHRSLVLQKITKDMTGNYSCVAANTLGMAESKNVTLLVKYIPYCDQEKPPVFGTEIGENVTASCHATAFPEPYEFRWTFNSSSELVDSKVLATHGPSSIVYMPEEEIDFGSLLCWAHNEIGWQSSPCVVHIFHSTAPDPVEKCYFNLTSTTSVVECLAGWDGGLKQSFVLEMTISTSESSQLSTSSDKNLYKSISKMPFFFLENLKPGSTYFVKIKSVNSKGNSLYRNFTFETLTDPAERRVRPEQSTSSWSGSFIASTVGILFVALVIGVLIRLRNRMAANRAVDESTKNVDGEQLTSLLNQETPAKQPTINVEQSV